MGITGPARAGFYYPKIVGGASTITFDDPAEIVVVPEAEVGTEKVSGNGTREKLHERFEDRVSLRFRYLQPTPVKDLRAWWRNHAGLGKQSALTLCAQKVPAALTAADSGNAGNVNVGTHSWVTTFVINGGETAPSATSNILTISTSAKQVNLSVIPTGPGGTTARKIYRTVAGDTGNRKLVTTLNDNTTTTSVDNVADGSLGADAPTAPNIGIYEFDTFNVYFSKAELLSNPFQPSIVNLFRSLYALELAFRQGQ